MPKHPDINLYVEKIDERIGGQALDDIRVSKSCLVRSFDPLLSAANDKGGSGPSTGKLDHEPDVKLKAGIIGKHN